jgi:CDP-diacylglycerol---glycerol-3-phosphate 3-phosphatidyltransferase
VSTVPGVRRFGPTAVATPANIVTLARVALTFPLLVVIAIDGPSWRSGLGWILVGGTDGLDGWLARRDGATRSGAFLDPLADKFLAIGGLWVLAAKGIFPWVAVVVIVAREVWISMYRWMLARRGVSLPARSMGKAKTLFQLLAVGFALNPITAEAYGLSLGLLWVAVALTLVSAADIVLAVRRRPVEV